MIRKRKNKLPTSKSVPSEKLSDYTWLIYGERKIGKTTLASQFDEPYFMMFEPGAKALGLLKSDITDWVQFKELVKQLEDDPEFCKSVVIDTGQKMYDLAMKYTLEKLGIEKPQDEAWGNAWRFIREEFEGELTKIINAGFGLIVLAHSEEKTITTKGGFSYQKISIQLGAQAFRFFAGVVDVISYYNYDKGKRVLTIAGNENVEAGFRIENHFVGVKEIDMGSSKQEAYQNIKDAFNITKVKSIKKTKTKLNRRKR